MKRSEGFTLIELLVVIAVIGLLSSVVLASLNATRMKARDARRLANVREIQKALDFYHDKYGRYPSPVSVNGSWEESYEDGGMFLEVLMNEGFLPSYVLDPINSSSKTYRYFRYGAGNSGCDASRGAYYVLGINDMETSSRPYSSSPGWSCPSRNWQPEFDWVIGKFEN